MENLELQKERIEELMNKHWSYYFNDKFKELYNMSISDSEQLSEINPICEIYNNCFEICLPKSETWNKEKYFVFIDGIDFEKFCEEQYFKIPNDLAVSVKYVEDIKDKNFKYFDPQINIQRVYCHNHKLLENLIEKRIYEIIDDLVANAIYQTNEAVKYDFDGSGEWN